jgi:hypothetical protein
MDGWNSIRSLKLSRTLPGTKQAPLTVAGLSVCGQPHLNLPRTKTLAVPILRTFFGTNYQPYACPFRL